MCFFSALANVSERALSTLYKYLRITVLEVLQHSFFTATSKRALHENLMKILTSQKDFFFAEKY